MMSILLLLALVIGVIAVNVHYYRARRGLTKEQRQVYDDELQREMSIW